MKITANDLKKLEIIDEIIKEPEGVAQINEEEMYINVKKSIIKHLRFLKRLEINTLLEQRYQKFRTIGQKYVKLDQDDI